MFKFLKSENKNQTSLKDYNEKLSKSVLEIKLIQEKLSNYGFDFDANNRSFIFIYNLLNKKISDALIICSYLGINDIPRNFLSEIFNLNEEYIDRLLNDYLPTIRFEAYKLARESVNKEYAFFPGVKTGESNYYNDVGRRVDVKFQTNRLLKELKTKTDNKDVIEFFIKNEIYIFMLDILTYKETLVLLYGLGLIDDEIVEYDDVLFKNIINNKIDDVVYTLNEKINYIVQYSYINNYADDNLLEEYQMILNAIDQSKKYINKGAMKK